MPDTSNLGLSKSKMQTTPSSLPIYREKVAAYARDNADSNPGKMLFPVIFDDEALKYPFDRAVQEGSSGSENFAWRSEKNVVQQTMLETRDNEVVKVMTRCSAVH